MNQPSIYQTKSGRLTEQRKRELRLIAKLKLKMNVKTPLTKVLQALDIEEDRFYRFMEDFIKADLAAIAKKMKNKELKNKKTQEKRKATIRAKKNPPVSFVYNAPNGFEQWREIMAQHLGQNITMSYIDNNNNIIETHEYSVPVENKAFRQFCKQRWFAQYDWIGNSEGIMTGLDGKMVVLVAHNINKLDKTINQLFREGETNCLLTPIKNWICEKLDKTTTKKSKERYVTLYNKVNKCLEQYPNGVPRENLNEISNNLNITISIELPFQKEAYILEKPITKSLTTFKYMNTTYNHVDEIIKITNDNIICTQEELYNKMKECDDNNISYYFTMNNRNINKLYVGGEIYGLSTNYYNFIMEFENKYNIHSWKINAIKHPELTKFLENSCHYNCCVDFTDDHTADLLHIDQKACYKNFNKCKYYEGFLSKITDFRFTNKIQGVGIYQITNIKITNEKFKRYNDYMNLYVNYNSYPSPSLKFLDSVGSYDIIGGCWGITNILDMEFVDEDGSTFMDKDNGVPFYSKYIGLCNSINYDKKYYLHGTEEIAQVIKQNTDCEVLRYGVNLFNNSDDNKKALTSVVTKKSHVFHLSHITSFILDYAKLNIIEQLMEMPFDNIVRVNSDGIYFMAVDNLKLKNNYVAKPSKAYDNMTAKFTTYNNTDNFCSNTIHYDITYNFGKYRDFYETELAIGGGGSGKTHFNLVDNGSINIMYIAPSWKLARNKEEEYKCDVATHASLLMCDPTNNKFSYSNVLLIDEVSMLTNEEKQKIMDFYVDWKLIFCGDIKYQLPYIPDKTKVQTEFTSSGFDNIMEFHTDYRATCDKLKELKKYTRELIDINLDFTPDTLFNKLQKCGDIEKTYNIQDMIICRTNKQKDSYKELFLGKTLGLEKYYITKTINKYCCGEIIITDKELPSECVPEIRHAFTIHSIQGETCHSKLFIHKDIMTLRMFYTAISRAKKYEQIYLIE
jgi:hypothetical protein